MDASVLFIFDLRSWSLHLFLLLVKKLKDYLHILRSISPIKSFSELRSQHFILSFLASNYLFLQEIYLFSWILFFILCLGTWSLRPHHPIIRKMTLLRSFRAPLQNVVFPVHLFIYLFTDVASSNNCLSNAICSSRVE